VLSDHGLVVAKLRGQGYDGASNMRAEFNGLQKLIQDENPYAFYIHCFAHELQLVLVAVSKCCSIAPRVVLQAVVPLRRVEFPGHLFLSLLLELFSGFLR
jgi:hypothetical protein